MDFVKTATSNPTDRFVVHLWFAQDVPTTMPSIQPIHFSTLDMSGEQAVVEWRKLTSLQYRVEPAEGTGRQPCGSLTYYPLGDIIANRAIISPQVLRRDQRLVSGTPDHILLQFWRTGGSQGMVDGRSVTAARGQTVLADRRHTLDLRFGNSDTIGLVIPRVLLQDLSVERFSVRLDPARSRLAAARINSLFRRLPRLEADQALGLRDELLAFVRRLLDPSRASDVLDGAELNLGVVELARRAIEMELGSPLLTPDLVADRIGVSRATLYRAFAGEGGLMRSIWEQRLAAVAAALDDPMEMRLLTRLAADNGFKSLAHLSRAFRARYGVTPRDWRHERVGEVETLRQASPDALHRWWNQIGL